MGEYIDNVPGKDDTGYGVNYRDSDPHNALVDTPLLSEDEFDIRSHRTNASCTVAEQGFHRTDDRNSTSSAKRQLMMAITLCLIFMVAEIIGGYMAGSLAIMADAAHLLSDCVSFIVSLVAIWMSNKPPDKRMTFGYKRAEVIGAIMSIFGIWLLTAFLCYFSLSRLIQNDFDIDARTMMIISGIGIIINVIMAFILHGSCSMPHGHSHGGGHGHSHSHSHSHSPPTKQYSRPKPSVSESASAHHNQAGGTLDGDVQATFIINGHLHNAARRSDSICSYRSPSHSRTNSFSRPNGPGSGPGSGIVNGSGAGGAAPTGSPTAVLPPGSVHHAVLQMRLDDAVSAAACSDSDTKLCVSDRRSSDGDCQGGAPKRVANLNLQAAVIHVIGDFIQSVGVFIAAVVINYYPNAKIVDPLCTVLFSIIVMCTTVRIMRSSFAIIMDAVPDDVDLHRLSGELSNLPGVRSVHDLNVWSVTVDWSVMAVHLVVDPGHSAEKILSNATEMAREDFGIRHCTIQLERGAEQIFSNGLHTIQRHSPHQHHHHHHHHDLMDQPGDAMIQFV